MARSGAAPRSGGGTVSVEVVAGKDFAAAYAAGQSIRGLAASSGLSRSRVRASLVAAGVTVRPVVRHVLEPDPQWWTQQLQKGQTITQLALNLVVPQTAIRAQLSRLGIASPPPQSMPDWLSGRVTPVEGCLRWVGTRTSSNGRTASFRGHRQLVHRLVWEHHHGKVPDGNWITRTSNCGYVDCVNIDHLQMSIPGDWQAINAEQGAFAHGEEHWNARLTNRSAEAILRSSEQTSVLADRYSVSTATVRAIKAGRRWKHLSSARESSR